MSVDPSLINDKSINQDSNNLRKQEFQEELEEMEEKNYEERFGLPPQMRVFMLGTGAGMMGALGGLVHGYQQASVKFLVSNSHRMPTTYQGWYFYHRRKFYYCLKQAMMLGFGTGCKLAGFVGTVFALETGLDKLRGVQDFGNTMMAVCIPGFAYAWWHRIPKVQAGELIRKGGRLGFGLGVAEDAVQFCRGADVWYLTKLGIKPRKLTDRIRDGLQ